MSSAEAPHVLVVEDDSLVRTFVRLALERDGMSVSEAEDGAAARQVLGERRVDALLVDGLLPDMHGVALADALLDDPRTEALPVCFLSGALQGRSTSQAGFGCLPKPVRAAALVAQVRALLDWRTDGGATVEERRNALRRLENGFLVGP
jgi:DNA-binding response OmpR family regulator